MSTGAILLVIAVYATQALAGWVALRLGASDDARRWMYALPRALLLGPLLVALQMLAWHALGIAYGLTSLLLPWWLVAAWLVLRRTPAAPPRADGDVAAGGRGRLHAALVAAACALALVALVAGLGEPVTMGDPMSTAALGARVFETHGSLAPQALMDLEVPPLEYYPPLAALDEAVVFLAAGPSRALACKPFFALAHLALLLLLVDAAFARLPPARAAVASCVLLLTPRLATSGMDGYLDERFTASVLLLGLSAAELARHASFGRAALFALAAGACALTKPQGLPLALLACAWPLGLALCGRLPRGMAALAVTGTLLLAAVWPLFVARHGLDAHSDVRLAFDDIAGALSRLPRIAASVARDVSPLRSGTLQEWGVLWVAGTALVVAGLLRRDTRTRVTLATAAGLAHLGAYVLAIALAQVDLDWQLDAGLSRWMLHLLPWAVLAALPALAPRRRDTSITSRA